MTPDEHAAEAERILAGLREHVGPDHNYIEAAKVHALLATRPTPRAELTDGPTALVNTISRTVAEQARPLTVVDYDTAVMRATEALREALPFGIYKAYTLRDVLPWAKAAVDAASYVPGPAPTTET